MEERQKQRKIRQTHSHHQHRVEIWVRNDGTSCEDQVDDNYDEDLSKLDAVVVSFFKSMYFWTGFSKIRPIK